MHDDILAMKLAAEDGRILWLDLLGGPAGLDDRAWSVVIGPGGDPVITGIVTNEDETADFYTARLDGAGGAVIWTRQVPGAINNPEERAGWLCLCDNGGVIMANRTWSPTTSYDVVLERYAWADGATVWAGRYGSAGAVADNPRGMVRDRAGDILVAGVRDGNYMMLKFRGVDGGLVWSADWDGPDGEYDAADCVAEGPGGEAIASGFSSGATTSWDAAAVAFDPQDGAPLWAVRYDGGLGLAEEAGYLSVSLQGDLYLVGYGYGFDSDSDILSLHYRLEPATSVPPSRNAGAGLAAAPNPFTSRVRLSMPSGAGRLPRIRVLDPGGRTIRVLEARGGAVQVWDGTRTDGSQAPPGVYWLRVDGGSADDDGVDRGVAGGGCKLVKIR